MLLGRKFLLVLFGKNSGEAMKLIIRVVSLLLLAFWGVRATDVVLLYSNNTNGNLENCL